MVKADVRSIDATVGRRIRENRLRLGLSAEALSVALSCDPAMILVIEAGNARPEPRVMLGAAALFNVPLKDLFT